MARKINTKPGKYKVAVIGEGITEWHYFEGLRSVERPSFDLKPGLPRNSSYGEIFKKALEFIGEGYDEAYCIIDMDVPDSNGLEKYQKEKNKVKKTDGIRVIETMPCTEFWFLIHYKETYSTHIYLSYQELEQELKKHLPDYEKTGKYFKNKKIYSVLKVDNKQKKAIENGKRYCDEKEKSDNPRFPFSEIGGLIEYLLSKKY